MTNYSMLSDQDWQINKILTKSCLQEIQTREKDWQK